jgi:hypothetical protein
MEEANMILTKDGKSYTVFGLLQVGDKYHVVRREFDGARLRPASMDDTGYEKKAAIKAAEATARVLIRQGSRPSSIEVFRASIGDTSGLLDPYVGFQPLPGEVARVVEKERAAAEKREEVARRQKLAIEELKIADSKAAAAKSEADRKKAEVEAQEATDRRVAQLAATDNVAPTTGVESLIYAMKTRTPRYTNAADNKALDDARKYEQDIKAAVKAKVDDAKKQRSAEDKKKEEMGEEAYSTYIRFKGLELD